MRSIKISRLLPALFVLMVLLGGLQGAVAFRSLSTITGQFERIGQERMPQMSEILQISNDFSVLNGTFSEHLLSMDPDELTAIEKKIADDAAVLNQRIDAYAGAVSGDPAAAGTVAGIKDSLAAYLAESEKLKQFSAIAAKGPALEIFHGAMKQQADTIDAGLKNLVATNQSLTSEAIDAAQAEQDSAYLLTIASLVLSVSLAIAAIFIVHRRVVRPLDGIAAAMKKVADGDIHQDIPHAERGDEIGEMAAAVAIFRDNAGERMRLERQAAADRASAESERMARDAERNRESGKVEAAVGSLGDALGRLASGDMTCAIDAPFEGELDRLRQDFNTSVARLREALCEVGDNARAIDSGAREIRAAADALARRTEQQAASVEETAAALDQITTTVRDSTKRAEEAGDLVGRTRAGAEKSGEVVRRAIEAMQQIERSSGEIGNIIGVIDDIAFQTNLLALNAGVEAARAGEAGKGFAVVAQEVRELAQRSAKAAREIKALITTSSSQVQNGVALVGETGKALETIVVEVEEINGHVQAIVMAAREQALGLSEINTAVGAMDQGTQQNAAMVEETTAASHGLASDVQALNALIGRFNVGGSMSQASRGPQLHVVPGAEPAAAGPTPSALPPGTASPRTAPAGTAPADAARAPSKGVVSQLPRKSAGQWNIKAASKTSRAVTSPAHLLNQKLAGALGARQADTKDGDWEEF